ncbi:RNA polymerase factor sigma-54 [Vulgatibacter sp.]|uniref:RNA polymerase factor sigma-54 n=1 Tax=Vulgatibacter sp. TaxID=1971226 RepID=UPI00356AE2BF
MGLELKQNLRMQQSLVMTPQLQQAIKLLQLSRMELESLIRDEIEQNPVLEENTSSLEQDRIEAVAEKPSIDRFEEAQLEPPNVARDATAQVSTDAQPNEIDWENYLNNYQLAPPTTSNKGLSDDLPSFEANLTRSTTLDEHLLGQARLADFTEEEGRVAEYILGNLDDDGYFRIEVEGDPLILAASQAGVSLAVANRALQKLQKLEPIGVCARDLQECLLIQARHWGEENSLVGQIIRHHLKHLETRNLKAIARDLKAELEDVIEAVKTIAEMNPKPGREYASDDAQYITPDVYVHKVGDEYVVVVNDDGLSKLKISSHYRDALKSGEAKANGAKDFIQEKLRSAQWLIRSIHQRQRTIFKVTESIVKFQKDFLDKGIKHLKPLILRDVAEDIGMHESTVSRVTTNKYVHTPQGIFELKYFFNSGIAKTGGDEVASEAVKDEIKKICAAEDSSKPYSDQKIVELLHDRGIEIARRTVAKYREMLGILPSSKRKKLY